MRFSWLPILLLTAPAQAWEVLDMEIRLRPNRENLRDAGAALEFDDTLVRLGPNVLFHPYNWRMTQPASGLFPAGDAAVDGAFTLRGERFVSQGLKTDPDGETLRWSFVSSTGTRHDFLFRNPHTHSDPAAGVYWAEDSDVWSETLAIIGPEEGFLAGSVDFIVRFTPQTPAFIPVAANDCLPDYGPSDLWLNGLSVPTQITRVAGDRVAFAPSAQLKNIGAYDMRWQWAIAPTGSNGPLIGPHPLLVMNAYRLREGRLEQIGRSDAKHAWNSVNQGCGCPGGQVMYQNCSDVYGVSNNANQFYFGPRAEVTAHSGAWSSLGSHFDASPVDDFRNHFDNSGDHAAFDHRLSAPEALLADTNDLYWVEAWYITGLDTNVYNNIAYRRMAPRLVGSLWSFSATNVMVNGPAIDAWVPRGAFTANARHEVIDTGEGRVHLAARVTRRPSGAFRYDYSVFNMDFDRGIQTLDLPVSGAVTNLWFSDGDLDSGNNWPAQPAAGRLAWQGANPLGWGTLMSFSLESPHPPASLVAKLAVANATTPGQTLEVATLAPAPLRLVDFTQTANRLTWAAVPGAQYQVEASISLTPVLWTQVAGVLTQSGATAMFEIAPAADPLRIFRVLQLSP
jgi:hypothetical protein